MFFAANLRPHVPRKTQRGLQSSPARQNLYAIGLALHFHRWIDPGTVAVEALIDVEEVECSMALALDMACGQVGESALAGDGCAQSKM